MFIKSKLLSPPPYRNISICDTPAPSLPHTVRKMTFSIKDFFCKCDQIHRKLRIETADLVTFTEKILNRKLHFCEVLVRTYQMNP